MSLVAASFTKSAVVGATPRAEFTPVFSPIDWANAGVDSRTSARPGTRYFIVGILFEFRMSHHTNWQCSGSFQLELLLQEIGCGGADVGARRSVLPEFSFAFDQQAWTALSAGWAPLPSQAYKTGFPRCFLEAF